MNFYVALVTRARLLGAGRVKRKFNIKNLTVFLRLSSNHHKTLLTGFIPALPSIYAESGIKEVESEPEKSLDLNNETISMINKESGWSRVLAIFQRDEYGNSSKELQLIMNSVCISCLIGTVYGGIDSGRMAFKDFMERNQATIFENPIDAKRKLQNHVTIHFGKGAFKYAWRLTTFTGGFMLLLTTMHAYRGKTGVTDYVLSGAVMGALARLKFGPPAIVVGGGLGGILGLGCGLATKSMLDLFGVSYDEILAYQYEVERSREKLLKDSQKAEYENSAVPPDVMDTFKHHESMKSGI